MFISDELHQWRSQLKLAQTRSIELYVRKKSDEENISFQNLSHMFIELRMHRSSDHYKRLEKRKHYDNLELEVEIDAYPRINVTNLFEPDRPGMTTPVRTLVMGKAGIGKTMLSMYIVDQWLRNELLPGEIDHLFLIHLRDLSTVETCSLEDLFFKYQRCKKPSPEAIKEFFEQLFADSDHFLLILDGWDEINIKPMEKQVTFEYSEQVDMPTLVASIINGRTLPSTRVLVTSRPGVITNHKSYNKIAEVYGFTAEKIHEYIVRFSGGKNNLQTSIKHYIDQNVNIRSLCYIPVQLNMICRIVKERMRNKHNTKLPETLTELFVASVGNVLVNHHPAFKEQPVDKMVDVFVKLSDSLLRHTKLARYGMKQVPIKITFSKKDIERFTLENITTQCGLVTKSREQGVDMFMPAISSVYYFQHITLQEFLAAVGLLTSIEQVNTTMSKASETQFDLVVMFIAGLLGNSRTHTFLDSLQLKPNVSLDDLITLVVDRERKKEEIIQDAVDRSIAHRASTLFLVMILYESRQVELWRHVSDYVLKGSRELDLQQQHISPAEMNALVYVLPTTGITSLL